MVLTATLRERLIRAVCKRPTIGDWKRTVIESLWLIPAVIALGLVGGFLTFGITQDWSGLLMLAILAVITPAIGEELIFRAGIIPRTEEDRSVILTATISVLAFVIWHPLQALIFGPDAVPVFMNPWFLLAVACLGVALARLYRATGSLWPSVFLHWLVVVGWKAFFGGPPNPFS